MQNDLVTGCVVVISCILLLKTIGDLWSRVNPVASGVDTLHQKLAGQMDALYKWHAPDQSGEQSWKGARLAESIDSLAESIDRQTVAHRAMMEELRDMKRTLGNCPCSNPSQE